MRSLRALAASSVGVGSIIAAGISGSALAQDAVQWRVEDGGNGHWYAFTTSVYGLWTECRTAAEARGATLAQVKTASLQNFIVTLANTTQVFGDYWIGASQQRGSEEPAGGWKWIDGDPLAFDAWGAVSAGTGAPPSPNDWPSSAPGDEDFLEICFRPGIVSPIGSWDDQGSFANPSLIEWSADCNADGIVDFGQIRAGDLADTNANNIPDCCEATEGCSPCLADIDESGAVNAVDLAAILSNWGTNGGKYPRADIDGNSDIDGADLAAVLSAWGPCP